jgi:hypothetical protein
MLTTTPPESPVNFTYVSFCTKLGPPLNWGVKVFVSVWVFSANREIHDNCFSWLTGTTPATSIWCARKHTELRREIDSCHSYCFIFP